MALPKIEGTIQLRGRYQAKIRVPEEIRKHWDGKEVYQKSLKTSDPKTAEKEVRAIRAIMDAQLEQSKAEEGWRALARHLPPDQKALLDRAGGLSGLLKQFQDGKDALAFMAAGEPFAGGAEIVEGPNGQPIKVFDDVDPEALQVEVAAHRAASAEIKAQTNARGRVLRQIGEGVELVGDVFSLRDLVEDWAPSVDVHTAENARTYVRRFTEFHGEIALQDLTGVHLREFTDVLKGLPKVQSGKRREMTVQQLIADAKKTGAETIGYSTQKKYFDMLKGLMSHAVGRRFVEPDPWAGMKLVKPKTKHSAEKPRRAFTAAEVRKILEFVKGSNADQYGVTTIDRWAPWIAAHHGLRLQEACQLMRGDFKDIGGVWSMQITDEGEEQKTKNAASVRWVPVHPALIAAGLRGVVEARAADAFAFNEWGRNSKKLEELTPDERGRVSANYGKRFSHLLRKKLEITDTKAVFHSFRHRFKDACDNVNMSDPHRRYLSGRANEDSVEGGYGDGAGMAYLLESLEKVDPMRG
ncbi:site-specific integrase [Shimia aestuarii]|uniref:Phage integrase family protein n=1 Tax=Shimia aestuarii TaxID=254406 RepID=A0A1I4ITF2_9RHOB|nr:site-specific integrase [Shimia aestuarii]SFL57580.1 Phage integrase family protein [Shimia aestuarii]